MFVSGKTIKFFHYFFLTIQKKKRKLLVIVDVKLPFYACSILIFRLQTIHLAAISLPREAIEVGCRGTQKEITGQSD